MMKQYLGHILASSLLLVGATEAYGAVEADQSTAVGIQRSFVNLDFSKPDIRYFTNNGLPSGTATNRSYIQISQDYVPGWRTAHSFWGATGRIIEIWRGAGVANLPNTSTDQYAELNAEEASALYQKVCLFRGENFSWSFQHAARDGADERAEFLIGTVADNVGGNATYQVTSLQSIHISSVGTTYPGRWVTRTGTATVGDKISATGGIYSFIFRATNGPNYGNLLDNIILNLKPAVEFSVANGGYKENSGTEHPVAFKIVGQITKAADMPTLNFQIAYDPSVPVTKRAIYDTDYQLYKRVGTTYSKLSTADGLIIDPVTKNVTFNYKPDYVSGLDYTQGVEVKGLVIKLLDNAKIEGDKTLPFAFKLDGNSQAIAASLNSCSQANSNYKFDLQIKDDDTDLEIIKSLTPDSVSKVYKDQYLAYTFELTNKTKVDAESVILKDNILANLIYETTGSNAASLSCEAVTNEGETAVCPTLPNDAVTQLFSSSGLNLGTVKGSAKYRFTLNKLKAKEDATDQYAGYVVNNAVVTTASTDIDQSNNTSTVKTMIAAKTDLSNNKAGATVAETGIGMFNITQEGRTGATPLLTQKVDSSSKAYFPLNIQNYGNLVQDYQLYASSTAIAPTVSTGDYSSLVKSGITPFTSGLKVEFYKADIGQCKAGISSQQITQLNVAANATGQVCAVVTAYSSTAAKTNIWFAIESLQSGLGDIILDAVIPQPKQRLLELTNDQSAQVAVGGTYVFLHRITNYGIEDEKVSRLSLVLPNDGFLYSLFLDKNKSDALDAGDTLLVTGTEPELTGFIIQPNQSMTLLIKVEAPTTATNGMSSQVKLTAAPNNAGKEIQLADLSNTDLISVSPNQLQILKLQLPVASCRMANAQAVISAAYTVQNASLKPNQCLIYKIMVKNSGSAALSNVTINDMYPAYTKQWASTGVLPIIGSNGQNITDSINNKIEDDGIAKIKAILKELLPQQEKSLYFGIEMK